MKILIVAKESKYEWERKKFSLSHEEIIAKYRDEKADLANILSSHERQQASRAKLQSLMPQADLMLLSRLKASIKDYDLVVSFGGDNSFSYVSHFVDSIPIVGINSDPVRSTGATCSWSAADLEAVVNAITSGNFGIEEWPRLQVAINGEPMVLATSELFLGERERKDMTRHVLEYEGQQHEQKSSGLIVATGTGSTGWYESAIKRFFPNGNRFPRTEKRAEFVLTEAFQYKSGWQELDEEHADFYFVKSGDRTLYVVSIQVTGDDPFPKFRERLAELAANAQESQFRNGGVDTKYGPLFGTLRPGEQLVVHSLNDGKGIASSDSWEEYDFSRGRKAVIKISDMPLRVVVPRITT